MYTYICGSSFLPGVTGQAALFLDGITRLEILWQRLSSTSKLYLQITEITTDSNPLCLS